MAEFGQLRKGACPNDISSSGTRSGRHAKQKGAVLIFTIAILAAIVAVLVAAASMQSLTFASAGNRMSEARAKLAAESGIQAALSVLVQESPNVCNQNDTWFNFGNFGQDSFQTNDGSFRVQILDGGEFLNLNSSTQTSLANLPLTQPQSDSLLDWLQTGATPRSDGAKDSFYNSLSHPYNTAEAPLNTIDELLLVNNFTPATLFTVQQGVNANNLQEQTSGDVTYQPVLYDLVTVDSKSSNTNAQGTALTNVNTATQQTLQGMGFNTPLAQAIIRGRPAAGYTTLGAVLGVPGMTLQSATTVLNSLTVSTTAPTGKVNINTASLSVLQSLPGMTTDTAQGIVTRQANSGFTSLGQITSVPGMSLGVLRQVADFFTINSQAFIVRVIGTAGNMSVPLEAVITLNPTSTATGVVPPVSVTKIYQPPFDNMAAHWHWDNQGTNQIDLSTGTQ